MKNIPLTVLFFISALPLFAGELFLEAERRIEKHRKEDVTLTVTQNGKPLAGVSVKVELRRHEFLFGCNILQWGICDTPEQNAAYHRRFAEIFNSATLPFFWWSYEQEPGGKYLYSYSDDVSHWCRQHEIRTVGHPLLWNWIDQPWAKDVDQAELHRRLIRRMTDCTDRFKPEAESTNRIETWVVCNELVSPFREMCRRDAPKITELMEKVGPAALAKECFSAARKGNPEATLIVNDYETGMNYVEWLEKLVDENGKPIYDVIGIQSHMHAGPWSDEHLWEVCERFARFDKPLYFTELTLLSSEKPFDWETQKVFPSTPEGEARQAAEAVRIYTMLFSHPKVEMITWWDLSDQGAWMDSPAGLLHADMTPKPAYDSLRKLIRETWTTDETLQTDAEGTVKLRAFRGEHMIIVTFSDGVKREFSAVVVKGDNQFQLQVGR